MVLLKNDSWDLKYLKLVDTIATFSKDPSAKVGALLIDKYNRPMSFGFNGMARGFKDSKSRLIDREFKLKHTIHAEQNAIFNSGKDLTDCTIYCTHPPCVHCMSSIVQVRITRVVFWEPPEEFKRRWNSEESLAVAEECGIVVKIVKRKFWPTIRENPTLLINDSNFESLKLPEKERKKFLEGEFNA